MACSMQLCVTALVGCVTVWGAHCASWQLRGSTLVGPDADTDPIVEWKADRVTLAATSCRRSPGDPRPLRTWCRRQAAEFRLSLSYLCL